MKIIIGETRRQILQEESDGIFCRIQIVHWETFAGQFNQNRTVGLGNSLIKSFSFETHSHSILLFQGIAGD